MAIDSSLTKPDHATTPSGSQPPPAASALLLQRRLSYIMFVRVTLFTLILGGTVAIYMAWGTPEELGGPYVSFLFVIISSVFLLTILYAILLRFRSLLSILAVVQISIDFLVSSVLVHFTGGAESAFVLFFLLAPIAAAVTLSRKAAFVSATVGAAIFILTALLGFNQLLPILPGQIHLPWEYTPGGMGRSLLINSAAMFAMAVLAGYLSEQLRFETEKVKVQQEYIEDLSALNANIIRCLTSGLITIDKEGDVLSINRAAADILGLTSQDLAGKPLSTLAPELSSVIANSGDLRRLDVEIDRGGTQQTLGVSISPLADHADISTGLIINFHDLTLLRRMEQQMAQAAHLASLGRIAAAIAHEIRNPLASISGSLELLRAADQLGEEDGKLMEIALREIDRLNNLITDFLKFARPQRPSLKKMDLSEEIYPLASAVSSLLAETSRPAIRVTHESQPLFINADKNMLISVLWNLIRNAVEAGEQGEVEIIVGKSGSEAAFLRVRDRGAGIPRELQRNIFEPFFTTKDKGSGLGLAMVHRIVMDHDGTIDVQSAPGQGASFTVLLPLADAP